MCWGLLAVEEEEDDCLAAAAPLLGFPRGGSRRGVGGPAQQQSKQLGVGTNQEEGGEARGVALRRRLAARPGLAFQVFLLVLCVWPARRGRQLRCGVRFPRWMAPCRRLCVGYNERVCCSCVPSTSFGPLGLDGMCGP